MLVRGVPALNDAKPLLVSTLLATNILEVYILLMAWNQIHVDKTNHHT